MVLAETCLKRWIMTFRLPPKCSCVSPHPPFFSSYIAQPGKAGQMEAPCFTSFYKPASSVHPPGIFHLTKRSSKARGRRRDGGSRGGGRGPRLCLGIRFRRNQPRIYIAGECPGLYPGVHFCREGSSLESTPASLSVTASTSYTGIRTSELGWPVTLDFIFTSRRRVRRKSVIEAPTSAKSWAWTAGS